MLSRFSCVRLFAALWTIAHQAPLSMGFSRQDYWSWFYHLRIEYCHLMHHVCMRAKSLQSCPTLCSLMDHSPAGSSVHGILQARTLEWVAVPPSKAGDLPSPGLVHHSPDHIIIFLTLYLSFHILLWFSLRIPTGRSGWLRWGLSGQKGRERKRN